MVLLTPKENIGFNRIATFPQIYNFGLNPIGLQKLNWDEKMNLPKYEIADPVSYNFAEGKPDDVFIKIGDGIIKSKLRYDEREKRSENAYGILGSNIPINLQRDAPNQILEKPKQNPLIQTFQPPFTPPRPILVNAETTQRGPGRPPAGSQFELIRAPLVRPLPNGT